MLTLIIAITVGIGVAATIGGFAMVFRKDDQSLAEDRLSAMIHKGKRDGSSNKPESMLVDAFQENSGLVDAFVERYSNLKHICEQADIKMSLSKILAICGGVGGAAFLACLMAPIPMYCGPIAFCLFAPTPFMWVVFKRNKRFKRINQQLPEALELLSRSLRAGHSLGAGIGLIAGEMQPPIAAEFHRCYEEQNLGKSLEDSLESMTMRVPSLDIRFFATAVLLQRQTGGDLAEILDKIGRLIRARFHLAGQIQSLTGEGRLSGIVLLALPPVLFGVMYYLNPEYASMLFKDKMGRQMLGGAIVMQVMGAFVIRKIINIKV